ncbi:MAG: helix-turn-helix transcriptional regulator [Actinobacteria bacterium]|nr:helix-turn-helix transcriptional regulator [Actinomycetota bacterium]
MTAPRLQDLLARNLRRVRRERGWSQAALAGRAQIVGLSWSRSTVADAEARRRDITVEDLVLLPIILEVDLLELVTDEAPWDEVPWVEVGDTRLTSTALKKLLTGKRGKVSVGEIESLAAVAEGWRFRIESPEGKVSYSGVRGPTETAKAAFVKQMLDFAAMQPEEGEPE